MSPPSPTSLICATRRTGRLEIFTCDYRHLHPRAFTRKHQDRAIFSIPARFTSSNIHVIVLLSLVYCDADCLFQHRVVAHLMVITSYHMLGIRRMSGWITIPEMLNIEAIASNGITYSFWIYGTCRSYICAVLCSAVFSTKSSHACTYRSLSASFFRVIYNLQNYYVR